MKEITPRIPICCLCSVFEDIKQPSGGYSVQRLTGQYGEEVVYAGYCMAILNADRPI